MARVLLAEDDPAIAEPLVRALVRDGYDVSHVADGAEALAAVRRAAPDLVLLDIGLPSMDGLAVCRAMREDGTLVPVIFLTARAEDLDLVVGLDAGGDDYVTKPFRSTVLLARVRAQLRRHGLIGTMVVGPVELDADAHAVSVSGCPVALTPKEFELLTVLMRHAGGVVSREQLMREVWATDWQGGAKTVDMHVAALRRKLALAGEQPDGHVPITTVRGVGFRFERG